LPDEKGIIARTERWHRPGFRGIAVPHSCAGFGYTEMMRDAKEESATVTGGCLCGRVRFEIGLPTLFCAHCHCSMCRKNHGAGFVTWVGVPYARFRITSGEEFLRRYDSSDHGWRRFCAECGSSMLCESSTHAGHIDVALGSLDSEIDRAPSVHVFADDRAGFVNIDDGLPRLGGKSGLEPQGS
jgi:hypothetical protein